MPDHARSDEEHQCEVNRQSVEDTRRLQVVGSEGGEVSKSPSAADTAAGKYPVCRFAFEPDTAAEEDDAHRKSAEDLAAGSPGLQFVREEKGEPYYEDGDANLIEPVGAKRLFEREEAASRRLHRWHCVGRLDRRR